MCAGTQKLRQWTRKRQDAKCVSILQLEVANTIRIVHEDTVGGHRKYGGKNASARFKLSARHNGT